MYDISMRDKELYEIEKIWADLEIATSNLLMISDGLKYNREVNGDNAVLMIFLK